ncbi:MAG: hypothetical protein GXP14_01640 [Gammaproteobacteria bacterium]|nr:hypothetical protein [Gammaproteobacteria bacterium]
MKEGLKEILLYGLVSISSLCILAYTVHMFVGGLVEKETEQLIMGGVVLTAAAAMIFMVRDVLKVRRNKLDNHTNEQQLK